MAAYPLGLGHSRGPQQPTPVLGVWQSTAQGTSQSTSKSRQCLKADTTHIAAGPGAQHGLHQAHRVLRIQRRRLQLTLSNWPHMWPAHTPTYSSARTQPLRHSYAQRFTVALWLQADNKAKKTIQSTISLWCRQQHARDSGGLTHTLPRTQCTMF